MRCSPLLGAALWLAPGAALAVPLDLDGLDQLLVYAECRSICEGAFPTEVNTCLASCPTPDAAWDKNGDGVVNLIDVELATLEYADAGTLRTICYEEIPPQITPTNVCADGDMEGGDVSAWTVTNGVATKITDAPYDGSQALRLQVDSANPAQAYQLTGMVDQTAYVVSIWYRSDGRTVPRIANLGGKAFTLPVSSEWQQFVYAYTAIGTASPVIQALAYDSDGYVDYDSLVVAVDLAARVVPGPLCGYDPITCDTPPNLVVDGDAEGTGTDAWRAVNHATLTKSTDTPHAGASSLRIAWLDSADPGASQAILQPGQEYRVAFWYRTDGATEATMSAGTFSTSLAATGTWTEEIYTLTTNLSGLSELTFTANASATGWVEVDDVVVEVRRDCSDADLDGLLAWQDPDDTVAHTACASNTDCDAFEDECRYVPEVGGGLCFDRACDGACTAFHLETVEENNQELVVHVHYDYSPYPATILDLKIHYDASDLSLVDSRALPVLDNAGKQLKTTFLADGTLRLVIMDPISVTAIPRGAIVELFFRRLSTSSTTLAFSESAHDRTHSMAPAQPPSTAAPCDPEDPGENCLLEDDALWGSPILTAVVSPGAGHRLLVHYDFSNRKQPAAYLDAPSAARICEVFAGSPLCMVAGGDPDPEVLAQLEVLQAGQVVGGQSIDGALGKGVYLDGSTEHLRLPLAPSKMPTLMSPGFPHEQSFALSLWFYGEGYTADEDPTKPQLLVGQLDGAEGIGFALYLVSNGTSGFDLIFSEGEFDGPGAMVLARGQPWLTWHHLALSVDTSPEASGGRATAFALFDGALVDVDPSSDIPATDWTLSSSPGMRCPRLDVSTGRTLEPRLQATPSDYLYYSVSKNGLYGIERLELHGIIEQEVLREPSFNARDADYYADHNKLVYTSDESGSYEIWIADGDGTNRKQVTRGFGDGSRGLAARRPRWAPSGDAILFESNIYSVGHNNLDRFGQGRTTQLYLIPYDAPTNTVAVPTSSGGTTTELEYDSLASSQRLGDFQLTSAAKHHHGAVWVRGGASGGEIAFTITSQDLRSQDIGTLALTGGSPSGAIGVELAGLALMDVSKLDYDGQGPLDDVALLLRPPSAEPIATSSLAGQVTFASSLSTQVELTAAQSGLGSLTGLLLQYDDDRLAPDLGSSSFDASINTGCSSASLAKLQIADASYVLVSVSGCSADILTNAPFATVVFSELADLADMDPYSLHEQQHSDLFVFDLADISTAGVLPRYVGSLGAFADVVTEAVFVDPTAGSLEDKDIVVSGFKHARPVLLSVPFTVPATGDDGLSPDKAIRLTASPTQVEGLRWRKEATFAACQWLGGHRDKNTGRMLWGFRGGMDELKIHSYVRSVEALQSEHARGHDQLERAGRLGLLAATLESCRTSFDCPAFQLCNTTTHTCQVVPCDPSNPACDEGLCALLPEAMEHETTTFPAGDGAWACTVECGSDSACFSRECANGPCRYCLEETATCAECKTDSDNPLGVDRVVGCPDGLRWACEAGTCTSECYVEHNGEQLYVCNELTEACRDARCEVQDWGWADFAPTTFSGLANAGAYYRAIPEAYPIEIVAFGNGDYLQTPEIVVEASTDGMDWSQLGRVAVHHQTRTAAEASPYVLYTDHALTWLRLRLYTPWSQNIGRAACEAASGTNCEWVALVSKSQLGYRVEIPRQEINSACLGSPDPLDCLPSQGPFEPFLQHDAATVIVLQVSVNGTSTSFETVTNTICPYLKESEGWSSPLEQRLVANPSAGRMIYGGNLGREVSARNAAYCAQSSDSSLCPDSTVLPAHPAGQLGFAVLNCDSARGTDVAALTLESTAIPETPPATAVYGNITETASSCTAEISRGSTVITEYCYEWLDDPSLDPMNVAGGEKHNDFEYSLFKSFSHTHSD